MYVNTSEMGVWVSYFKKQLQYATQFEFRDLNLALDIMFWIELI